jgi:hypothetical protein
MARVRKSVPLDLIARYYGINAVTCEVECVSRTEDGVLSMWRDNVQVTYDLGREDTAELACVIYFGLREVRHVPRAVLDDPIENSIRARLEARALAYRSERVELRSLRRIF